MLDYIRIGLISKAQGIKGELKVLPLTDDVNRFLDLKEVYIENGLTYEKIGLKGVRFTHDSVFILLEHIYDRTSAEKLRGKYINVPISEAVPLPEGRYFIFDIIGCKVYTQEDELLGEIVDVLQPGANDVYVIKGEKEIMLPALKTFIVKMDVANKKIIVNAEMLKEVAVYED